MKAKLLFIMAFLFLGMGVSFGQKIKKKEIDKFTKNEIIETSTETLYAVNFMASGWIYRFEFQLRRVNGEYSMPANILMQEMVKYTEDDGVTFLLDNDETVFLKTSYTGIGADSFAKGYNFSTSFLLSKDDVEKFKFTKDFRWADVLRIENFSDENFNNANIVFTVVENTAKYNVGFKNEKPFCEIMINPVLTIAEVNQEGLDDDIYVGESKHSSKKLLSEVDKKIEKEVEEVMDKLIKNNLDVNLIYEHFNANHHKQFQKFLSALENKDEFLQHIEFKYKCNSTIN